ncbi:methyltransferase [Rhodoferax sp.]|uniref:methyltransferase family protein n=1 Tax=Rhodoferax sp. TaxID=50421 RepID=UPI0025F688B3|nr:methyltransferase [Rhodoferax sp.]
MKPHTLGTLLVSLQFGTLGALCLMAAPALMRQPFQPWVWLLLGLSGVLGLWALLANRPGNFNIRPTPHASGKLIAHGPYRWIRHPMYTAVMLLGLACVLTRADVLTWLLWGVLCLVLATKAVLEERWMMALHPSYAHYQSRTHWFIPYLL